MKLGYIFILFTGILLSSYSYGSEEDCRQYIGSCEYYLCREKNRPCNGDGYFIAFGYKYCTKLLNKLLPKVKSETQDWLNNTAKCLQEQADRIPDSFSCSDIKKEAIKGHGSCYEDNGFCSLSLSDKMKILKAISPSLKVRGVLPASFQVLHHCLQ